MSAARASGPGMVGAALRDAMGGPVSLLFASGAAIDGELVSIDMVDGAWAQVLERFDVEVGGASRTTSVRHTVDTSTIVAVGVPE